MSLRLRVPENYSQFDFSFPLGAYGLSSGWPGTRDFTLSREPDLAPRRLTALVEVGSSVFVPIVNGEFQRPSSASHQNNFAFLCKVPPSQENCKRGIPGLSSGGGSAIFKKDGRAYKLKRCGMGDKGFISQTTRNFSHVNQDGECFEISTPIIGGLMELPAALTECQMTNFMHSKGLTRAYRPTGVIIVNDSEELQYEGNQLGAALIEIQSDLRMDELSYMTLSPMLADLFASRKISYDGDKSFYNTTGLPLVETWRRWGRLFERLEMLGLCVGSAYRRLHDAGILRGLGSSWFGNEVIDAEGEISIADFDGGTEEASLYPRDVSERIKQLELTQYCSMCYFYLGDNRPKALGCFGAVLSEAVRQGYQQDYCPIPTSLLEEIINEHLAVYPVLREAFSFPADTEWLDFYDENERNGF